MARIESAGGRPTPAGRLIMSENTTPNDEIPTLLLCDPITNRQLREVLDD